MRTLLLAAALAFTAPAFIAPVFAQQPAAAPAAATQANPAMWKIKGTHGTVYLFGSVHVMKKEVNWQTPKVSAAFKSSDMLYLEIPDLDEAGIKSLQPLMMQMGIDMDHPLSTKLSKEDIALLDTAVKSMGLPGEQALEPMKPWLVYLTLSVLPAIQSGYDPNSGIDKVLATEAKAANKPAKGFETVEQQVHYLADFPEADQIVLLHETLVDLPKSTKQMDEVVTDWTKGDVDKIAAMDNDELKLKHPELYDKLLVKRNVDFATQIAALLKDPATGTIFVAIGAGHLAGPDSVIKMLEKKGFTVSRDE